MPATSPPGPVPARPGGPFDTVVGVLQAPPRRLEADAVDFPDETCHLQRAGRGSCGVLLGRCLRRTEVVGEGRQISRLRCGQVGERRVAWRGVEAFPRVDPARTATAMSKALSPSARPLPSSGWKAAGWPGR